MQLERKLSIALVVVGLIFGLSDYAAAQRPTGQAVAGATSAGVPATIGFAQRFSFAQQKPTNSLPAQRKGQMWMNNLSIPTRHFLDRSRIKPYPVPYPKHSEWEDKVTVCIAAETKTGELVTVSDFMISTAYTSSDNAALKTVSLNTNWHVMFAGNDISPVTPILGRVHKKLKENTQHSPSVVSGMFCDAFQEELNQERERRVLATYGLNLQSFLQTGSSMDALTYADLRNRFEQIALECEFLVCGFGMTGSPFIFSVGGHDDFGRPCVSLKHHNQTGFFAIGSGQYNALTILYALNQNSITGLSETIYNVLAAKFMAESALGVGKNTWPMILRPNQSGEWLEDDVINAVRDEWNVVGKPRRRPQITTTIESLLAPKALTATAGND